MFIFRKFPIPLMNPFNIYFPVKGRKSPTGSYSLTVYTIFRQKNRIFFQLSVKVHNAFCLSSRR